MVELEEDETIIKKKKGDYWQKLFFMFYSQVRGEYIITNKRIVFKTILGVDDFVIRYEDIVSISKHNVGPLIRFIPTGILIKTNKDKKIMMSVLGRKKYMQIINSYINIH